MTSPVVYRDSDSFDDGTRYEMIATTGPKSEEYPEGVKYRFQYMTSGGRTLLRFDNYPNHPGVDHHHYHTAAGVYDDIECTGLGAHVQMFYDAVAALRGR